MRRIGGLVAILFACVAGPAHAGEDSPWPPDTASTAAQVRATRSVLNQLEQRVELMELSARRYANWEACLRPVGVSEYGDPDRQFGYAYDEVDGTGRGPMPALAVDRGKRPDYLFLSVARQRSCTSNAPVPGGTADASSLSLRALERRAVRLKRALRHLDASSERFDAWESCVSWVPVTEYGDPDGAFGYLFGSRFRPALAVDRSDWDDPDYMFLAFVGGDRPGGTCRSEPGEGVD